MAGDTHTAAAVMRMEAGLDTGPVCHTVPITITPEMTAGELHDLLSSQGAVAVVAALARLEAGTLQAIPQPEQGITYAAKITKDECRIDFSHPAQNVHDHVRGLSPFPGAWFEVTVDGKRERLRVLATEVTSASGEPGVVLDDAMTIACGNGSVRVLTAQRAGKKPMPASEILRGFALRKGLRVGGLSPRAGGSTSLSISAKELAQRQALFIYC
jgi:methionyl-tRNA formyltransferase